MSTRQKIILVCLCGIFSLVCLAHSAQQDDWLTYNDRNFSFQYPNGYQCSSICYNDFYSCVVHMADNQDNVVLSIGVNNLIEIWERKKTYNHYKNELREKGEIFSEIKVRDKNVLVEFRPRSQWFDKPHLTFIIQYGDHYWRMESSNQEYLKEYENNGSYPELALEIIGNMTIKIPPMNESREVELVKAAMNGEREEVLRLLGEGVDINAQSNEQGYTPLIAAVKWNQLDIVNLLLSQGSDINARDKKGETALMHAVANGNAEMIKTLLSHKPDLSIKDNRGYTALMTAERPSPQILYLERPGPGGMQKPDSIDEVEADPEIIALLKNAEGK